MNRDFKKGAIMAFSNIDGVAPEIIVGQLHTNGFIE